MTPELRGLFLRSNPEVYNLGSAITFKPDYLSQAKNMDAPEVWGISINFTGTVGAVTGGAGGRDAAKLFDNIRFRNTDDVLNVSGAGARVMEQLEYGFRQQDPADIASGSTNASYSYILRLPFGVPFRAKRSRDYTIPVSEFLNAGEFTIQTASAVPTGWAAQQADWRMQLVAWVRDGRKKELKSRRRVKEEAMTQQEFDYQINGFCRSAIITSKLATTGYTSLAAFTTVNSRTLKFPAAFNTRFLLDEYRQEAPGNLATNDEFTLAAPGAIAFMVPRNGQKIGNMVDMKSLHIDLLQAAPTSGRLITDVLIDRNADSSAAQLGYDNPGQVGAAVKNSGVVVGNAGNYDVRTFNGELARKMPLRVKAGKM
jgi:hypothetical protein